MTIHLDHGGSGADRATSRFAYSVPRNFLYPTLLLLLAEAPQHGYGLAKQIEAMRAGSVDRPSVYRALATLSRDGLLNCDETECAGRQPRRTYRLTDAGARSLHQWMSVIDSERDGLQRMLQRYSTGPGDGLA
ncbi:MAG: helix-turn-helix transcriptional regulator [Ilumatobacteraceae bacterium]